jgi:amino acid transporter
LGFWLAHLLKSYVLNGGLFQIEWSADLDKSFNGKNGNAPEEVALSRDLNLFTITMIGVGGMIGAGIFVLTGIAAGVAGPALVLAFFLNGVVTIFTAMVYAELGSAFPEAGGGYLWVKEGLGGANGFLSGWMSWFAHAVAGSLYGLGFGRFAAEFWLMLDLPKFGLDVGQWTLVFTTVVIVIFTFINYRGASETGTIGNIVTVTKISILGLFVFFRNHRHAAHRSLAHPFYYWLYAQWLFRGSYCHGPYLYCI